jgi:alanyl aminopeptidase
MPMALIEHVGEYAVADDQRVRFERWARGLYQQRLARLGWQARPRETEEDGLLRAEVIGFLALVVEDPAVRRQAAQRARRYLGIGGDGQIHTDAVPPELVQTVLVVAAQDGDAALFDAMWERFAASEDGSLRRQILAALGSFREAELAARARELTLRPELRPNERFRPLRAQFDEPRTRDEAWRLLTERFDAIAERAGASIWTANLPALAEAFCSAERADEVQRFFEPRVEQLSGGPRNLAGAVETIRLCAARVDAHRESVASFFSSRR